MILVTCDLLLPTGQRHCTGSKEVWCHFNDLRLVPRRLRVRGQTGHQYPCEIYGYKTRRRRTRLAGCRERTAGPNQPNQQMRLDLCSQTANTRSCFIIKLPYSVYNYVSILDIIYRKKIDDRMYKT